MVTRGTQNGQRGLERCPTIGFWVLPSTFAKYVPISLKQNNGFTWVLFGSTNHFGVSILNGWCLSKQISKQANYYFQAQRYQIWVRMVLGQDNKDNPKFEDNLKHEDHPKNKYDTKNEDYPLNQDKPKKKKITPKKKTITPKMKTTPKIKISPKMRTTKSFRWPQMWRQPKC